MHNTRYALMRQENHMCALRNLPISIHIVIFHEQRHFSLWFIIMYIY